MQCNATQRNATQRNATQRNATQRNATQRNASQYNTIQYNTIQYNTIQYNTRIKQIVLFVFPLTFPGVAYQPYSSMTVGETVNTIQYNTMQCNAMQCNAMQCSAVQCCAVQCSVIQLNGYLAKESGECVSEWSSRNNYIVAECFLERSSWCRNDQDYHG